MAGVSDNENKEVIKDWIHEIDNDGAVQTHVLDIGAGTGTYSKLAKREGEVWTALEVFYPYVNMFGLHDLYESVIIGDARYINYSILPRNYLLSTNSKKGYEGGYGWDLIIAADMLEHMTREDAKNLIQKLTNHCRRLLICFPVEHQEQHAGEEGNDFETHVDHWTFDEMDMYLRYVMQVKVEKSLVGDVLAYFMVRGKL